MAGTIDIAITQLKQQSGPWQHNGVCFEFALKLGIKKNYFLQRIETTEIKCVFISDEGYIFVSRQPHNAVGTA